jgi:hypothetical protein
MIEIDSPGAGFGGREGIEQYLGFLHAAAPDTLIEPASIADDRGQLFVHLSVVREPATTMLGIALDEQTPLWPEVEALRVAGGQIIERRASWDGMAILAPETDFAFELDVPERRELAAALNNYAPRTMQSFATIDAPEILRVLDGEVAVALSDSAAAPAYLLEPASNDGPPQYHTKLPGQTAQLAAEDVAVIPPGSAFTVTNLLDRPASVLRLSASIPLGPGSNPESLASNPQHGISVHSLASLRPGDLDGPAHISLGTVTLMPGGRLAAAPDTKLLIACPDSGTPRCMHDESGCERNGMVQVYQFLDMAEEEIPLLLLARESGREVLVNVGLKPATAWIIAVSSA